MKKHLLLLISILVIGGLAINLPNFLVESKERREAQKIELKKQEYEKKMQDIGSKIENIENPELSSKEREPELYDKQQIYFKDIEELYKYFMFGEIEDIKQKVQFYIHENINKDILDCSLKPNSIRQDGDKIIFELMVKDVKQLEVQVTKNNSNNSNNNSSNNKNNGKERILDITILHSI